MGGNAHAQRFRYSQNPESSRERWRLFLQFDSAWAGIHPGAHQKCKKLKEALETSYPGQTSLELIDLTEAPEEKASEAGQLLVKNTYPAPLVVIDGAPRFAGSIQVIRIVKEVGKILNA